MPKVCKKISTSDSDDEEITVKINRKEESISKKKLKLLSYFRSIFAQRWSSNRSSALTAINIGEDLKFDCTHLKWLLKCVSLGKISLNSSWGPKNLEGLINCDDFFTDKQESVINTHSIIEYIESVVPRPNIQQRLLLQKTKNAKLKTAMERYVQQSQKKIKEMQLELVKNHSKIQAMDHIRLDHDTSFMLLKEKLKFNYEKYKYTKLFKIKIINFRNKEEYMNLIDNCHKRKLTCDLDEIYDFIFEIDKPENQLQELYMNLDQYAVVEQLLDKILTLRTYLAESKKHMDQQLFQARLLATCKVAWRLYDDLYRPLPNADDKFKYTIGYMKNTMVQEFTLFLLSKHANYCHWYKRLTCHESAKSNYYRLLKRCLQRCSKQWLQENAPKWFPIMVKLLLGLWNVL